MHLGGPYLSEGDRICQTKMVRGDRGTEFVVTDPCSGYQALLPAYTTPILNYRGCFIVTVSSDLTFVLSVQELHDMFYDMALLVDEQVCRCM